jgi:RNA polymerase sigma-70 factor (ECF subfamily)
MNAYDTLSDLELAEKFNQSDKAAFSAIYDRYWTLLYRHAHRMLKDSELAGDVVQDIFTSFLDCKGKINTAIPLSSYLYASVRNRIINMMNREKLKVNYVAYLSAFMSEGVYTTDHTIREKELRLQIEKEIENLPPKMRAVFEMSRKAYLNHKEIAEKANISEETVKRQISYAMKILRSKLTSHLFLYLMSAILMLNKIIK